MNTHDKQRLHAALPALEELKNDIERAAYEQWVNGSPTDEDRADVAAARRFVQRARNAADVGKPEG